MYIRKTIVIEENKSNHNSGSKRDSSNDDCNVSDNEEEVSVRGSKIPTSNDGRKYLSVAKILEAVK
jgi:hypothetical protein